MQTDIEQEVSLTLWEHWADDRRIDYPVAYLYKVALRTALATLRASATVVPVEEMASGVWTRHAIAADPTPTTEHAMLLTACLNQLPVHQSRAIRAYLTGFTQREIAHRYG